MELLSIKPRTTLHHRWTTVMFTGAAIKDLESVKRSMEQEWETLFVELSDGEIQVVEELGGRVLVSLDSNGLLTIFSN